MPTYQYRCKECGHDLEIVQAFTDDALTECPQCQGALKKVYGNVGISFKGSGFYKNDSRPGAKTKASTTNGSATSESSSTSSESTPSTPSTSDTGSSSTSGSHTKTKAGSAASSD